MNFVTEQFNHLIDWIEERELVRKKKEAGLRQPWTQNEILRTYRFCNVNRNDDRETRWIHKNIIKLGESRKVLPPSTLLCTDTIWFNLVIARFINWSPTLNEIGYILDWATARKRFLWVMNDRRERKEKCYTGAYMIRAGTGADAILPKEVYLCRRVFDACWERRKETNDIKDFAGWDAFFGKVFGMGDFMRNQVITDLKYTKRFGRLKMPDWDTFFLAGPGTRRGLNRLRGRLLASAVPDGEVADEMIMLRNLVTDRVIHGQHPELARCFEDMNNLGNCLCEFDKYMRVMTGEGRPRSKYEPSDEPLP